MTNNDVLQTEEIAQQLKELDGWSTEEDKKITKNFNFKNFKEALAFTNQVGAVAEAKQHHPDIYLTWGKVTIDIQTHEANGLTKADFDLAKEMDKIAA